MDKTHGNYKSAKAIQSYFIKFTVSGVLTATCTMLRAAAVGEVGVLGMAYVFTIPALQACSLIGDSIKIEYILYGYRKALKDYDQHGGQTGAFKQLASRASFLDTGVLPSIAEGKEEGAEL
eukprot:CAMPEP_0172504344 /NCGR_PEP_ID=MMETSP1066-20121228/177793_1 /TAXON_ID=671091 /ORGANISM="Coscinodiscus wailesii, Strain CCMP2513" /LENGTH=120 /DNA_ID=CAMNT_0013280497 /DNA_START=968 /DNA_END=1330 /DNA_ORIENTATION=-